MKSHIHILIIIVITVAVYHADKGSVLLSRPLPKVDTLLLRQTSGKRTRVQKPTCVCVPSDTRAFSYIFRNRYGIIGHEYLLMTPHKDQKITELVQKRKKTGKKLFNNSDEYRRYTWQKKYKDYPGDLIKIPWNSSVKQNNCDLGYTKTYFLKSKDEQYASETTEKVNAVKKVRVLFLIVEQKTVFAIEVIQTESGENDEHDPTRLISYKKTRFDLCSGKLRGTAKTIRKELYVNSRSAKAPANLRHKQKYKGYVVFNPQVVANVSVAGKKCQKNRLFAESFKDYHHYRKQDSVFFQVPVKRYTIYTDPESGKSAKVEYYEYQKRKAYDKTIF